jgi:hypothetical protein
MGSTRGSALAPVIEAIAAGSLNAEIVAVLSNRSSAPILDKGRALGPNCTTEFTSCKGLTRAQYDAECSSKLVAAGVDLVLLVGYMRILRCVRERASGASTKEGSMMTYKTHTGHTIMRVAGSATSAMRKSQIDSRVRNDEA